MGKKEIVSYGSHIYDSLTTPGKIISIDILKLLLIDKVNTDIDIFPIHENFVHELNGPFRIKETQIILKEKLIVLIDGRIVKEPISHVLLMNSNFEEISIFIVGIIQGDQVGEVYKRIYGEVMLNNSINNHCKLYEIWTLHEVPKSLRSRVNRLNMRNDNISISNFNKEREKELSSNLNISLIEFKPKINCVHLRFIRKDTYSEFNTVLDLNQHGIKFLLSIFSILTNRLRGHKDNKYGTIEFLITSLFGQKWLKYNTVGIRLGASRFNMNLGKTTDNWIQDQEGVLLYDLIRVAGKEVFGKQS